MDSYKTECFALIQDFKKTNIQMDWATIFECTDFQDSLNEALSDTLYQLAFVNEIDQANKIAFIGNISYLQSHLVRALAFNNKNEFITTGEKLEKVLQDLISTGSWAQKAEENFDLLEQISEENVQEAQKNPALAPVLLAISLASIISCEQAADECCDEE